EDALMMKENQELRAAMRKVCGLENADIDTFIDAGWGDVFQVFHRNHGRYPEQADLSQASAEYSAEERPHGNPKLNFYLSELEVELNALSRAAAGNDVISECLARVMVIFHRVKDSRKEGGHGASIVME